MPGRDCFVRNLRHARPLYIPSLCTELNLLPISSKPPQTNEFGPSFRSPDRLQVTPKPLEAKHVINLQKQLLACEVGHFADGSLLSIKMTNYNRLEFLEKLGDAIATIIEGISYGGAVEPSSTQSEFEEARDDFNNTIRQTENCSL